MGMSTLQKIVMEQGCWAGAVYILHKNEVLVCLESVNMPSDWRKINYDLEGDSLNAQVFRFGEPVILNELHVNRKEQGSSQHPITAMAVVPVVKNTVTVGTLELIADKENFTFDPKKLGRIQADQLFAQ
jgi:GAF domain-containing protein